MKKEKTSRLSKGVKAYVIDTNVILNNAHFENFIEGDILIPDVVLEELDNHKNGFSEKAFNARTFARKLDKNFENYKILKTLEDIEKNDLRIIGTAKKMLDAGYNIVLVTNDIYMSCLARSMEIPVQKQEDTEETIKIYSGVTSSDLKYPNQYQVSSQGIHKLKKGRKKRIPKDAKVLGISHKNLEQRCLIDALTDKDIPLVTVTGSAGTGKTLLSIVCGLQQVIEKSEYRKLVVARPVVPMGNEVGFLPGELNEKLAPWMQPVFDNIDYIFSMQARSKKTKCWEELEREGFLQVEALTYIRGRSIPDEFILIDEAQNLSPHEIKTIVTRAGHGTKIVITGDINQIDNPKLDQYSNGLTYAIERFKNQEVAAHINLNKCERSELAKIAGEIL